MSEVIKLNDETMENISGGMTANLKAAYACINGDYGNGEARFAALRRAGFDPNVVQGLVNDLLKYEKVAKDVINGKYGNGEARKAALAKAGYPYDKVQNLVNNMLL
jgi:Cpl-7 lysozyme C-terminal domain.